MEAMATFIQEQTTYPVQTQATAGAGRDEHFTRQVASYKHWLTSQTQQHREQADHEINEYAERAMKIVEVDNKRIQTFTPFRYKYSALQTITRKQVAVITSLVLCWAA